MTGAFGAFVDNFERKKTVQPHIVNVGLFSIAWLSHDTLLQLFVIVNKQLMQNGKWNFP